MTKKIDLYDFRLSDLDETDLKDILEYIDDEAFKHVLRKTPQTQLKSFIDSKGFRIENTPVPKIKSSLIKGVLLKNSDALAFMNILINITIQGRPLFDWIHEYRESHDLDLLYRRIFEDIIEHRIQTQPLPWLKIGLDDDREIPVNMKVRLDISVENDSILVMAPNSEIQKPKKPKETTIEKSKKTQEDQITKLKKEISDLKEKQKREIESIKHEQSSNYRRYLEKIRFKINQMSSYAADVELTKAVEKNELKTVEQVWDYLMRLENETGADLDSSDVRRILQKIAVMKFMVLAGKDEN